MRTLRFVIFVMAVSLLFGSCTVYRNPILKSVQSKHLVVAILPFNSKIAGKNFLAQVPKDTLIKMQKNEGELIQKDIYLNIVDKKDKYSVKFQAIEETNFRLQKAGLYSDSLNITDIQELIKILQVDAIIIGSTLRYEKSWASHIFSASFASTRGDKSFRPSVVFKSQIYGNDISEKLWEYNETWLIGLADHNNIPRLYRTITSKEVKNLPYK